MAHLISHVGMAWVLLLAQGCRSKEGPAAVKAVSPPSGRKCLLTGNDIRNPAKKWADPAGSGRIWGLVFDETGTPVEDVLVYAENSDHFAETRTSNGNYQLVGVSDGDWTVSFLHKGVVYIRRHVDVTASRRVAIYARIGGANSGCEVLLPSTPRIEDLPPPPWDRLN